MQRETEPGWSNPKVLTIFALIFLCGAAFGGAITRSLLHRVITHADPRSDAMESARRFGLKRLTQELELTSEQQRFVTQELDDYSKYYQNIEEERQDVAEHGKDRIFNRLTDKQKRKFTDLLGRPMTARGP